MELEKKVKLMQIAYAVVLADSALWMGKEGILEKATAQKREEQLLTGKLRAAQFGVEKPEEVFTKLAELFGCATGRSKVITKALWRKQQDVCCA